MDQAGVLGSGVCARVTAILMQDEAATSDEIAVAVVPTTGDASIEAWSTGLFNTWGVGKHGKDSGVLLVVAVDDHRVRLETGRGMADRLSDAQAGEIVNGTITPRFAKGEYAAGILAGLDEVRRGEGHVIPAGGQLVDLVSAAPSARSLADPAAGGNPPPPAASDSRGAGDFAWFLLPLGLFIVLATVLWRRDRRLRGVFGGAAYHSASTSHTYLGGGGGFHSSGSSGSSFGGGGSDGGGASGSW